MEGFVSIGMNYQGYYGLLLEGLVGDYILFRVV